MKKILYIDMDNVLVDFPSAFEKVPKRYLITHKEKMDEVPRIFSLMDPLPGALDSYKELSPLFDTYILSTSPWENESAWSDKLKWVKNYLGENAYKRLILSHHKNLNAGDFLIDDRLANGADKFQGEHIHFGTDKFPNWESVVNYLKSTL
jgi:5'(3')-deoxyribonucleotidase